MISPLYVKLICWVLFLFFCHDYIKNSGERVVSEEFEVVMEQDVRKHSRRLTKIYINGKWYKLPGGIKSAKYPLNPINRLKMGERLLVQVDDDRDIVASLKAFGEHWVTNEIYDDIISFNMKKARYAILISFIFACWISLPRDEVKTE